METSLLFKTLIILSAQLGIVLVMCFYTLKQARLAYENNTTLFGTSFRGSVNMKNKLNLIPYIQIKETFPKPMYKTIDKDTNLHEQANNQDEVIKLLKDGYFHQVEGSKFIVGLMWFWFFTLFATTTFTSFLETNIWVGITIFTLCSLSFGPLLAWIMLEMDENDGFTAMKIVLVVTILTGFIGYGDYISFADSTLFAILLFVSLIALLLFNFARFFIEISRATTRAAAIFGSFLFSLYLLYDFNYIKKQSGLSSSNDWETALEMAFILYLDIINLLLEILDAMSN